MASSFSFTLDQKKAHDSDRHLSITANAGSGKTRVLVSRYCDLVQYKGVKPADIAAITFTEKAASELRNKIAAEFEERLGSEEHKGAWELLKRAREEFTSAIVSTIHGFCSQLLREFPIEANVPPNFAVISGYERKQIEEETLNAAIEEMLSGPKSNPEEITAAYDVARRIGREQMEQIVRMMLWKREPIEFARRHGVLKLDRKQTLDLWHELIDRTIRNTLASPAVVAACTELIGHLKEKNIPDAHAALSGLRGAKTTAEIVRFINELRGQLLTQKGELRQRAYDLPREDIDLLLPVVDRLNAELDRAGAILAADPDPALHEILYDDTQILLNIYNDTIERYEGRKARLNALDFEDLQLRLMAALDDEEAYARIAGRFRYIMVDEFQDTNELQYSIAYQLLERLQSDKRLCIVGDKKQSIYGFRNAEVEVFDRANVQITARNSETGTDRKPLRFRNENITPDSTEEALGIIKLDASFRLLPSNCAYVNEACGPIMRPPGSFGFGVDYEPLVCARRSNGRGGVEFILAAPEQKDDGSTEETSEEDISNGASSPNGGPDRCSEAELIARRILGIVQGEEPIVWESLEKGAEESPRPGRFSDVAILCRKRSHFPAIEHALRTHGIPFLTHGSIGFYKTQEIYDVVSYLRVLLNSRDDVALLGVLRSPYFCVSDAELYRVSCVPKKSGENDLWSRAVRWADDPHSQPALRRAVDMIADDRTMASRIPVSLLIRRFIERTGWRGAAIGSERGEQVLANVDKLLEMARDFEAQGFTNLFDFVEQVKALIELEELEGEAAVNTGRDAVRLMTMHAAKGLEFPIVVLPSLHSPTPGPSAIHFDKDLGFGWNWKFNKEDFKPGIAALMNLRATERERAEEARLFYVAITRARDLLILSGEYEQGKTPKGIMLSWALGPFDEVPQENSELELTTDRLSFLEPDGRTKSATAWKQSIRFHLTIDDLPKYSPHTEESQSFRIEQIRIGELRSRAEGDLYSATQFMVYSQCPTKYYLKYRLGIPEDLTAAYDPDFDPNARDSEDGTVFARLFRKAALRIDEVLTETTSTEGEEIPRTGDEFIEAIYGQDVDSIAVMFSDVTEAEEATSIDERDAAERITDDVIALEPIPVDQATRMRERLTGTLRALAASDEARAALTPEGSRPYVEHELRIPFGRDYLLGVMDRMLVSKEGTISVLHYKTRRLSADDISSAAHGYLPQLRLYAYLVSLLNPDQRTFRAVILFTEHPGRPQEFTFTRFDMRRVEEELQAAFDDIRALSYTGRSRLPLRSPHCPACPFWIEKRCIMATTG